MKKHLYHMDNLLAMLDAPAMNIFDILRIAISIVVLGYSCVTDLKIRRAPNRLWYFLGAAGLVLGCVELYLLEFSRTYIMLWLLSIVFMFVLMYFLYYFFQRLGMTGIGGADAKALIAIGIMFPLYPEISLLNWYLPVTDVSRSLIFGLAVFGNALALNLAIPVGLLIYNLARVPPGELMSNPLSAFTGYKADVAGLKGKHVRLMERYSEEKGQLKKKRAFGGSEIDDDAYQNLLRWKSEGRIGDKVWVTPKIPFLVPITLGFLVAVTWGDILTQAISLFVLR